MSLSQYEVETHNTNKHKINKHDVNCYSMTGQIARNNILGNETTVYNRYNNNNKYYYYILTYKDSLNVYMTMGPRNPCERAGWRSFRGKGPDEAKERDSRMIEETSA
jgi:hypothetical protein